MFIEEVSIMMITLPVFVPLIKALHIDDVWFGILMLMVLEISLLTPPVGVLLYTIAGVTPREYSMGTIWKAVVPYVICGIIAVTILLMVPSIVTVLVQ